MGRQQVQANELQAKSVRVIILTNCIPVLFFLPFPFRVKVCFEIETHSQDGCVVKETYNSFFFRPGYEEVPV